MSYRLGPKQKALLEQLASGLSLYLISEAKGRFQHWQLGHKRADPARCIALVENGYLMGSGIWEDHDGYERQQHTLTDKGKAAIV